MANKAPRATRNTHGDVMPNWGLSLQYDTQNDLLYYRWWRADLLSGRGPQGERSFAPDDVEDALSHLLVTARTLSARRLF